MNTPEPCCRCGNLYVDAMSKDDPSYAAECMVPEGQYGDKDCPKYVHYTEGGWSA